MPSDFCKAIALFSEAYHLADKPAYIYNIAYSYEQLNECHNAQLFDEKFLEAAIAGTTKPITSEKRAQVQVSINMTNFKKSPLHRVFECVKSEAERHGVAIVGSEIVGLTPAEALIMTAEHYLRLENFSSDQVLELRLMEE
jgi:hypothetical protein